jgi:hypothetical protein
MRNTTIYLQLPNAQNLARRIRSVSHAEFRFSFAVFADKPDLTYVIAKYSIHAEYDSLFTAPERPNLARRIWSVSYAEYRFSFAVFADKPDLIYVIAAQPYGHNLCTTYGLSCYMSEIPRYFYNISRYAGLGYYYRTNQTDTTVAAILTSKLNITFQTYRIAFTNYVVDLRIK